MNVQLNKATAAPMPPMVADAIPIDIEGAVIPPVTVSAPKEPHLRNRIIMCFLIYVVLTYPFSFSVCRKVWPLVTNGGDSRSCSWAESVSRARADAKTIIRTMAGADTQAELLGVEDLVIRQFNRNQQQFNELVDYAHDSAIHDYYHFVGVSVDILDSLMIKLDGVDVSLDVVFNGLNVDLLGGFEVFVASELVGIADFLRPLQGQLQFLGTLLKTALSTIQDLIDQTVYGEVRKYLGPPFDLIWNKFNAPNLSLYANLPDGNFLNSLDLIISIPGSGSLPSTSAIWDFVGDRADDFKDLLEAALNGELALLRTSIGGTRNFLELQRIRILKDYDPPKYPGRNSTDIRGLKRLFGEQKEMFQDAFRVKLNALTSTAALLSDENNTFVPPTSTIDLILGLAVLSVIYTAYLSHYINNCVVSKTSALDLATPL